MKHLMSIEEIVKNTYKDSGALSESDKELLPVFDSKNNLLGVAPRLLCHRLGLIHKVAYLMVFNEEGRILLQTRGDGRLDIAVGGHVSATDISEKDALIREAKEELHLSVKLDKMQYIGSYFRDHVFNKKKPAEFNREIRALYYYVMSPKESEDLDMLFSFRLEKSNVIAATWNKMEDVITACNMGNAADGLKSSLPYYSEFLSNSGSV